MNLRLLAAATLLPLTLSSCKILQMPFNMIRSITGGRIVENAPPSSNDEQAAGTESAVALKDTSFIPFAPPSPPRD